MFARGCPRIAWCGDPTRPRSIVHFCGALGMVSACGCAAAAFSTARGLRLACSRASRTEHACDAIAARFLREPVRDLFACAPSSIDEKEDQR